MIIEVQRALCNHCHQRFYEIDGELEDCPHCGTSTFSAASDGADSLYTVHVDSLTGECTLQLNEKGGFPIMETLKRPISGLAHLFEMLAHVKRFPISLRFAAVCSGIGDDEARRAIQTSPYAVIDEQIIPHADLDCIGQMTIINADRLYRQLAIATYCKDGRPAWCFWE
jgi:hypothetical protein